MTGNGLEEAWPVPRPELPDPTGGPERLARALERRRGHDLTAAEKAVRRRNRRWMLVIAVPAIVIGVAALVASLIADSSTPSMRPVRVPTGYKAVSDGVFAYAVPSSWSKSSLYSDDVGDLDTSGTSGWAAEHVAGRQSAPFLGEAPPSAFQAFGLARPAPFEVAAGRPMSVPGVTAAFRYLITRPGGFRATAIDAWKSRSGAEIWLLLDASPATTAEILGTLRG